MMQFLVIMLGGCFLVRFFNVCCLVYVVRGDAEVDDVGDDASVDDSNVIH